MMRATKQLIGNLFNHFSCKEQNSNTEFKYYTYKEPNVKSTTLFESLSNANLIGIYSKLDKDDVAIVMMLFQIIIDEMYELLEIDEADIQEIKSKEWLDEKDISYLKENTISTWIKYLDKKSSKQMDISIKLPEVYRKFLSNNENLEFKYFNQKYFRLQWLHPYMKFEITLA